MSADIAVTVITMLDDNADPTERANAATAVLTYLYGGGAVPIVWASGPGPNGRARLIEIAREIRGLRQTLAQSVPDGTITSEEPLDEEPQS